MIIRMIKKLLIIQKKLKKKKRKKIQPIVVKNKNKMMNQILIEYMK